MSEADGRHLAVLAGSWLAYFVVHSLLASLWLKSWIAARFPGSQRVYRLAFNGLAVLTLLPILWLSFSAPGPLLWAWRGPAGWLANGVALAAGAAFVLSLKYYDTRSFLGLRQWTSRQQQVGDEEDFQLSPFHRYVRHPWYFFALLLIWSRDMSSATLLSAVLTTIYLVVGAWLEERKLLVYHGAIYRRYMKGVPGLLPRPWKSLSADDAARLVAAARAAKKA